MMENALKCNVCLAFYDSQTHKPRLLPSCGHTVCELCIRNLLSFASTKSCPQCRRPNALKESLEKLPVNYNLLQVVENFQKDENITVTPAVVRHISPCHNGRMMERSVLQGYTAVQNLVGQAPKRNYGGDLPGSDTASGGQARCSTLTGSAFREINSAVNIAEQHSSSSLPTNPHIVRHRHESSQSAIDTQTLQEQHHITVPVEGTDASLDNMGNIQQQNIQIPDRMLAHRSSRTVSSSGDASDRTHIIKSTSLDSLHRPMMSASAFYERPSVGTSVRSYTSPSQAQSTVNCPVTRSHTVSRQRHHTSDADVFFSKRLQEELDFQMAVHVTFCKDSTHNHDGPVSRSLMQYPEDEDLKTALKLSK